MDPRKLYKEGAKRAALSTGNIVLGLAAVVATAATANPLPLIFFGLGSGSWIFFDGARRYANLLVEEEKANRESRAEDERKAILGQVEILLSMPPFDRWLRSSLLPDYRSIYERLVNIKGRVAAAVHDRPEFSDDVETSTQKQLDYMLIAFIKFVRDRIHYMQNLALLIGVEPDFVDEEARELPVEQFRVREPTWLDRIMPLFVSVKNDPEEEPPRRVRRRQGERGSHRFSELDAPLTFEQVRSQLTRQISELKRLAAEKPASAKARQAHIAILEQKQRLLAECEDNDQRVSAQLDAFLDAFQVILARVSARSDVTEVTGYLGSVVRQVEETEKFAEANRSAMDTLGDFSFSALTA